MSVIYCLVPRQHYNPAHGPYTRYKNSNCSNHGQHTYLIQTQQQVLSPSVGAYY